MKIRFEAEIEPYEQELAIAISDMLISVAETIQKGYNIPRHKIRALVAKNG